MRRKLFDGTSSLFATLLTMFIINRRTSSCLQLPATLFCLTLGIIQRRISSLFPTLQCDQPKNITLLNPTPPTLFLQLASSNHEHHLCFKLTIDIIQQRPSSLLNAKRRRLWDIDNSDLFKMSVCLGSLRKIICSLAINGPDELDGPDGFDGHNGIDPRHKRGNFPRHKRGNFPRHKRVACPKPLTMTKNTFEAWEGVLQLASLLTCQAPLTPKTLWMGSLAPQRK